MDEQLKEYLDSKFATIDRKFEAIDRKFEAIDRRFDAIDRRFDALEASNEQRFAELDAKIERVETNLLTAFHKWASPAEARMRGHRAAIRALEEELEAIADRLKKLEDNAA